MPNKLLWPVLIFVSASLAGFFTWTNSASPLRSIVVFLFMLLIPGIAYTRLFEFDDILVEIVLAVALSLVASTIMAEAMLFLHIWSPEASLDVLIGVSLLGAGLQLRKGPSSVSESEA